jgi:hypothetical protein
VNPKAVDWKTFTCGSIMTTTSRTASSPAPEPPDTTLALSERARALWMHMTRHNTCDQFCRTKEPP